MHAHFAGGAVAFYQVNPGRQVVVGYSASAYVKDLDFRAVGGDYPAAAGAEQWVCGFICRCGFYSGGVIFTDVGVAVPAG